MLIMPGTFFYFQLSFLCKYANKTRKHRFFWHANSSENAKVFCVNVSLCKITEREKSEELRACFVNSSFFLEDICFQELFVSHNSQRKTTLKNGTRQSNGNGGEVHSIWPWRPTFLYQETIFRSKPGVTLRLTKLSRFCCLFLFDEEVRRPRPTIKITRNAARKIWPSRRPCLLF